MSDRLIIRQARSSDAERINELSRNELGYDHPPEKTRDTLEVLLQKDIILVAETDGGVVGYIHLCDYELLYAPRMKNVLGIAVDARYRRMGIGSSLLREAERLAAEDGAAGIRLVSGKSRTGAHAFYESAGYYGGKEQINFKKKFWEW